MNSAYDALEKDEEAEALYRNMCSIDMLGVDASESDHPPIIYEDGDDPNYQGDMEPDYEIEQERNPPEDGYESDTDEDNNAGDDHRELAANGPVDAADENDEDRNDVSMGSPVNVTADDRHMEEHSESDQHNTSYEAEELNADTNQQNVTVGNASSSNESSDSEVEVGNEQEPAQADNNPVERTEQRVVAPLTIRMKPVSSKQKIYSSSEEESDAETPSLIISEDKVVSGDVEVAPLTMKIDKNMLQQQEVKNPLALLSEGEKSDSDGLSSSDESSEEGEEDDYSKPPSHCRNCGEPFDVSIPKGHKCSALESTDAFWMCTLCEDVLPTEEAVGKHISSDEHLRCVFCKKKISVRPAAAHKHVKECPKFPSKDTIQNVRKKTKPKRTKPPTSAAPSVPGTPAVTLATTPSTPVAASGGKSRRLPPDVSGRAGSKRWNKYAVNKWANNVCSACGMAGFDTFVSRFLHFKEYHHKNICLDCGAIYSTPQPLIIHMKKVHGKHEHEHPELDRTKTYDSDALILCIDCNKTLRFSEIERHFCKVSYGRTKAQQAPTEAELDAQAKPVKEAPPPVTPVERPVRNRRRRRGSSASELSVGSEDIPFDDSEPETKSRTRKKSTVKIPKPTPPVPARSPGSVTPPSSPRRAPSPSPERAPTPPSESSESEAEQVSEPPRIPTPEPPPRELTPEPLSPVPHIPVDWKSRLDPLLYKLVLRVRKMLTKVQETGCKKCLSFENVPASIEDVFSHLKEAHDLFLLRGLGADTESRLFSEVKRVYMRDISQTETEELGEQKMVKPFCIDTSKQYACTLCHSEKMPLFEFVNHLRIAHSFKYYPCVECGRRFRSYGLLLSHLSNDGARETLYGCRICKVSGIQNVFTLQSHIRTHSVCERCFSGFDGQLRLKNHLYAHQKERPFWCTACDKPYKTNESLEMHLLWKHGTEGKQCPKCDQKTWQCTYHFCPGSPVEEHHDELVNKCTVCRLDFKSPEMLRVHNRLHSGTRPHKCDQCERAFISRKLLQKHKDRVHSREIKLVDKVGDVPKRKAMDMLKKIGMENRGEVEKQAEELKTPELEAASPVTPHAGKSLFDIDENDKVVEEAKPPTPPPKSPAKPKEQIIPYFFLEHDYCKPGPLPEVRMRARKRTNSLRLKLPKVHLSSSSSGSESSSGSSESSSESESESSDSESPSPKKLPLKKEQPTAEPTEVKAGDDEKEVNVEDSESSESETDSIASEPDESIHESDLESEGSETERRFKSPVKDAGPVSPPKPVSKKKPTKKEPPAPPKKVGGLKVLLPKHLQRPNGGLKTLIPSAPKPTRPNQFTKKKGLKVLQPKNQVESSDDMSSDADTDVPKNKRKRKISKLAPSLPPPKKAKTSVTPVPRTEFEPPAAAAPAAAGQETGKLYCYCRCPYDEVSQMIGCDASDCPYEWFHFECVGIMIPPEGRWYCPDCRLRPKYQGKST